VNRPDYDALRRTSWSQLKWLAVSPAHYRWHLDNPPEQTDAMRLGSAFHGLTLEPEQFDSQFALWDGPRRAGKIWEDFEAAHAKECILTLAQYDLASAMASAARATPEVVGLMAFTGQAEHTVEGEHLGVQLKGRLDWLSTGVIVDLKSTKDTTPRAFGRQMAQSGVLSQLALYRHLVRNESDCYLIAVENKAPHTVCVYRLTEQQLSRGWEVVEQLLAKLKLCEESDYWPGPSVGVRELEVGDWQLDQLCEVDDG